MVPGEVIEDKRSCPLRIAQMTWYKSLNYGSVLQAYALNKTLCGMGHEVFMIDYDPALYQNRDKPAWIMSRPVRFARRVQLAMVGVAPYAPLRKQELFREFYDKVFVETAPVITAADFKILDREFDSFVCGSDQIWSPRCFDPRYFLDFVDDPRRKIAYAPSFGCEQLDELATKVMVPLMSSFDHLSAREGAGVKIMEELCGKKCELVLDPTLLLEKGSWEEISKRPQAMSEDPYCLCYFLGGSDENWRKTEEIARTKGLRLAVVPVFVRDARRFGAIKEYIGPREFLYLVNNAEYVCTDSFHGLVFSTVFEKDFSVFERFKPDASESQNVRIDDFLKLAGLQDRLETSSSDKVLASGAVNFEEVRRTLARCRLESLAFLEDALYDACRSARQDGYKRRGA